LLAQFELTDLIPAHVLSLPTLEQCGLEDVEKLLDPNRLYKLINRIKSAGLSPREFLNASLTQSAQLTERLKAMPLPHDPALKSVDNVLLKLEGWRGCLRPWAHDSWN